MIFATVLYAQIREADSVDTGAHQLLVAILTGERGSVRSVQRPADEKDHEKRKQNYAKFGHAAGGCPMRGMSDS